jgi:hypothetical protein
MTCAFDLDRFLSQLAASAEERGLSIAWCAEFGMPEVAAKMAKNVFDVHEFQCALKRCAATELSKLTI